MYRESSLAQSKTDKEKSGGREGREGGQREKNWIQKSYVGNSGASALTGRPTSHIFTTCS